MENLIYVAIYLTGVLTARLMYKDQAEVLQQSARDMLRTAKAYHDITLTYFSPKARTDLVQKVAEDAQKIAKQVKENKNTEQNNL